MDATVIDAYVHGRLAGANFFYARQRDERCERPDNPYVGAFLAAVEWDRGFNDGYEQGHRGFCLRAAAKMGRKAA